MLTLMVSLTLVGYAITTGSQLGLEVGEFGLGVGEGDDIACGTDMLAGWRVVEEDGTEQHVDCRPLSRLARRHGGSAGRGSTSIHALVASLATRSFSCHARPDTLPIGVGCEHLAFPVHCPALASSSTAFVALAPSGAGSAEPSLANTLSDLAPHVPNVLASCDGDMLLVERVLPFDVFVHPEAAGVTSDRPHHGKPPLAWAHRLAAAVSVPSLLTVFDQWPHLGPIVYGDFHRSNFGVRLDPLSVVLVDVSGLIEPRHGPIANSSIPCRHDEDCTAARAAQGLSTITDPVHSQGLGEFRCSSRHRGTCPPLTAALHVGLACHVLLRPLLAPTRQEVPAPWLAEDIKSILDSACAEDPAERPSLGDLEVSLRELVARYADECPEGVNVTQTPSALFSSSASAVSTPSAPKVCETVSQDGKPFGYSISPTTWARLTAPLRPLV
uniref:Selenoprotein O n=1 Tax=Sexangularia sp. CB-2014 TaxID=1486929 RepID=A0A7S1VHK9_9EUKA